MADGLQSLQEKVNHLANKIEKLSQSITEIKNQNPVGRIQSLSESVSHVTSTSRVGTAFVAMGLTIFSIILTTIVALNGFGVRALFELSQGQERLIDRIKPLETKLPSLIDRMEANERKVSASADTLAETTKALTILAEAVTKLKLAEEQQLNFTSDVRSMASAIKAKKSNQLLPEDLHLQTDVGILIWEAIRKK